MNRLSEYLKKIYINDSENDPTCFYRLRQTLSPEHRFKYGDVFYIDPVFIRMVNEDPLYQMIQSVKSNDEKEIVRVIATLKPKIKIDQKDWKECISQLMFKIVCDELNIDCFFFDLRNIKEFGRCICLVRNGELQYVDFEKKELIPIYESNRSFRTLKPQYKNLSPFVRLEWVDKYMAPEILEKMTGSIDFNVVKDGCYKLQDDYMIKLTSKDGVYNGEPIRSPYIRRSYGGVYQREAIRFVIMDRFDDNFEEAVLFYRGLNNKEGIEAESLILLMEIARGIQSIHKKNCTHMNLKPDNVLINMEQGLIDKVIIDDDELTTADDSDNGESDIKAFGAMAEMLVEFIHQDLLKKLITRCLSGEAKIDEAISSLNSMILWMINREAERVAKERFASVIKRKADPSPVNELSVEKIKACMAGSSYFTVDRIIKELQTRFYYTKTKDSQEEVGRLLRQGCIKKVFETNPSTINEWRIRH